MQKLKFAKPTAAFALLVLAACGDGSDSFDLPPDDDPGPPPEPPSIGVDPVFTQLAFDQPLAMMQPPGDDTRWFVVEKAGVVREFPNDAGAVLGDVTVFADISDRVDSTPSEGGLLGMAFHPDFAVNEEVFLSYTRTLGEFESVISRFTLDPSSGALDVDSEEILLTVPQFAGNHNGGNLVFGPDGFLYIGFGDGGGSGDPQENGQDTTNVLGTILRIDVDSAAPYAIPGDNPLPEIPNACRVSGRSIARRFSPGDFATPGASVSIGRPVSCGSATSDRTPGRK